MTSKKSLEIIVLISGHGSNLQAIIDKFSSEPSIKIMAVITDNPSAYGLERAKKAHIPAHVVLRQEHSTRQSFEQAIQTILDNYQPQLIALAGFMRRLSPFLVKPYVGRMINIHPSLLPQHPGLHTHQRVLEAKDAEHGVTVHYVTDILDGGPIISQAKFPVTPQDTAGTLATRVHALEHLLYPTVISWIASQRLCLSDQGVYLDGHLLPPTGYLHSF
jgi:phosphoribosylglycinamide formyltransferase-1